MSVLVEPAGSAESVAPAPPLRVLVLPCLVAFVAWELARLGLSRLPWAWGSTPLLWSLVRALLLLTPALLVTRRLLGERVVPGFWLRAPERRGLLRSSLIGAAYLVLLNGLDVALGNPFTMPSVAPGQLALTLFDAGVEEALFRGFLLSHLLRGRHVAEASLIAASMFLLAHARKLLDFWTMGMLVELAVMALAIFVMGLVLGATARPVRSIWIATIVHGINNLLSSI